MSYLMAFISYPFELGGVTVDIIFGLLGAIVTFDAYYGIRLFNSTKRLIATHYILLSYDRVGASTVQFI